MEDESVDEPESLEQENQREEDDEIQFKKPATKSPKKSTKESVDESMEQENEREEDDEIQF